MSWKKNPTYTGTGISLFYIKKTETLSSVVRDGEYKNVRFTTNGGR